MKLKRSQLKRLVKEVLTEAKGGEVWTPAEVKSQLTVLKKLNTMLPKFVSEFSNVESDMLRKINPSYWPITKAQFISVLDTLDQFDHDIGAMIEFLDFYKASGIEVKRGGIGDAPEGWGLDKTGRKLVKDKK